MIERTVEYSKINYVDFSMYDSYQFEVQRHRDFISLLVGSLDAKEYRLKQFQSDEEPTIIIELIEVEENYIFGLIAKLDDLSTKLLLRFRNKDTYEIHDDVNAEEIEYYLENFTYFYVRTSDLLAVVLSNSSAPSFNKHFGNLLKKELELKHNFFDGVSIIDFIDRDVKGKFNRFKEILKLNIGYANFEEFNDPRDSVSSLDHEYGVSQSDIEYINVDIGLKSGVNQNKMKKKLEDYTDYDEYSKFEVEVIDENDATKAIDLIKNIIKMKIKINIEQRHLMSTDGQQAIKKELKSALDTI